MIPARPGLLLLFAASIGAAACDCDTTEGEAARLAQAAATPTTQVATCDLPAYGHPALAALYAITDDDSDDGAPALLSSNPQLLRAHGAALGRALEAALTDDLEPSLDTVPRAAAIVVLSDAWGALSRVTPAPDDENDEALARGLAALIAALAAAPAAPPANDGTTSSNGAPPLLRDVLPADDGWREVDTEHTTLGHERAFGLRRVFRLFVKGTGDAHEARALASQLVTFDDAGHALLSDVVGEVEMLTLDADGPTSARVLHLDRSALGCGEVRLHEESEVSHIPGLGADFFLLDLPAPEPLATMPCQRCHGNADAFSLPSERTEVRDRIAGVLTQIEERHRPISLVSIAPPSAQ